jgi:hypothetical protein
MVWLVGKMLVRREVTTTSVGRKAVLICGKNYIWENEDHYWTPNGYSTTKNGTLSQSIMVCAKIGWDVCCGALVRVRESVRKKKKQNGNSSPYRMNGPATTGRMVYARSKAWCARSRPTFLAPRFVDHVLVGGPKFWRIYSNWKTAIGEESLLCLLENTNLRPLGLLCLPSMVCPRRLYCRLVLFASLALFLKRTGW